MEEITKAPAEEVVQNKKKTEKRSTRGKHSYRTQPYDHRSPSANSAGTPCGSSDESPLDEEEFENVGSTNDQKKYRRIQANKRERTRMHTVNAAFDCLRDLVPTYPSNRKLSKIETLRLACAYIQDLAQLLNDTSAMHGEDVNIYGENFARMHHLQANMPGYGTSQTPFKTEFSSQDVNCGNFHMHRAPSLYVASVSITISTHTLFC